MDFACHVYLSFALVFGIFLCCKNKMLGLGLGVITCILMGVGKEVYDIIYNPWNLPIESLWNDFQRDMWANCLGMCLALISIMFVKNE